MKQDDYFKSIKKVGKSLASPSSYLKQRIMNNSKDLKPEPLKSKAPPAALFLMALLAIGFIAVSLINTNSNGFVVGENYVANFNLNDFKTDNISFVEVELPDSVNLVSSKLKNKKKIVFVWSIFSESKVVSFPFKANQAGEYDLKVKLLNDDMEVINIKSMKVDISKG